MSKEKLSASRVKKYNSCPRSYWHRYVQGDEERGDTRYLDLGLRVHEAIEETLVSDQCPDFTNDSFLSTAILNKYEQLDQHDVPDDLYETGEKCCRVAAKHICKQQPEIRAIEDRVEFDIAEEGLSVKATGYMDIATENEVWDWKTGRIDEDRTPAEERIQGSMYMAGFYVNYGVKPDAVRFIYLKEGKKRKIDPTDENWEFMVKRAKNLITAKQESVFPANPGDRCYHCNFELACSESAAGMGSVSWEDY